MKQIDLPLYKFYLIEGMTQEDLNELALERNNLSEEVYRLNNIINELEKDLKDNIERCRINFNETQEIKWIDYVEIYGNLKDKLQELKGDDK